VKEKKLSSDAALAHRKQTVHNERTVYGCSAIAKWSKSAMRDKRQVNVSNCHLKELLRLPVDLET